MAGRKVRCIIPEGTRTYRREVQKRKDPKTGQTREVEVDVPIKRGELVDEDLFPPEGVDSAEGRVARGQFEFVGNGPGNKQKAGGK